MTSSGRNVSTARVHHTTSTFEDRCRQNSDVYACAVADLSAARDGLGLPCCHRARTPADYLYVRNLHTSTQAWRSYWAAACG